MAMRAFLVLFCVLLFEPAPVAVAQEAVVRPEDYRACGLTSFYTVCQLHKVELTWREAQEILGPPHDGGYHSFADIEEAGRKVGLVSRGLRLHPSDAARIPTPAVVQSKFAYGKPEPHLLVLSRATPEGVFLLDPPYPQFFLSWDDFQRVWTGNALLMQPQEHEGALEDYVQSLKPSAARYWAFATAAVASLSLVLLARRWLLKAAAGLILGLRGSFSRRSASLRLVFALAAIALVVVGWGWLGAVPPTLHVPEVIVNLGVFAPGQNRASFSIHNVGDQVLEVKSVESTCACAAVHVPDSVPARRGATIVTDLNVQAGVGSATIRFSTNDPAGPKAVRLVWHGRATPFLTPAVIAGTGFDPTQSIVRKVRISYPNAAGAPVPTFSKAKSPSNLIHIHPAKNVPVSSDAGGEPGLELRGHLELDVTIDPPLRAGSVEADLRLFFNYAGEMIDLPLRVYVEYRYDLTPTPDGVIFSSDTVENLVGQTRQVFLRTSRPPSDFQIAGTPGWLGHEFTQAGKGSIALTLRCLGRPDRVGETLELALGTHDGAGRKETLRVTTFANSPGP